MSVKTKENKKEFRLERKKQKCIIFVVCDIMSYFKCNDRVKNST